MLHFDLEPLVAFRQSPTYRECRLADLAILRKTHPSMQKAQLAEEGIPYLHYGQIHTQNHVWLHKLQTYADTAQCGKATWAAPNDIILTGVSEYLEGIAKPVAWLGDTPCVVSGGAYVIHQHGLDPLFLTFYLQSSAVRKQLRKLIKSATYCNLSLADLGSLTLKIPPLEIQQLIGNFLSLGVANAASLTRRR